MRTSSQSFPQPATIGVLSTYPPTQCGLATFTSAFVGAARGSAGSVSVVRVVDTPERETDPDVALHLVNGSAGSARHAARHLNSCDVALIQHEYGIFAGPDGGDVLDIVDALRVPTVVVLHTVLSDPLPNQRRILLRLLASADVVVTMTETARTRLIDRYGADPDQVVVIPHGAIDHGATDLRGVPALGHPARRPTVLTWGLIGPGKGIEWAVEAMSHLRDLDPLYLVVGKTHPKVVERDGEAYREGLRRRMAECDVDQVVELRDGYLEVAELASLVTSADVVLLPYDSREQVTSGVLIEAVAAGRPVVSTAFPHAIELLTGGPGLIVPQRDPAALAGALRRVLTEPALAASLAELARAKAPDLLWPAVAARYQGIADTLAAEALAAAS